MAATGRSGGEDRYVAACVRLQTRGCSRKKKKRQECGTRRKETGVAREMRRDANWVGLNDGLSPGLESLCCGSGNFMGH